MRYAKISRLCVTLAAAIGDAGCCAGGPCGTARWDTATSLVVDIGEWPSCSNGLTSQELAPRVYADDGHGQELRVIALDVDPATHKLMRIRLDPQQVALIQPGTTLAVTTTPMVLHVAVPAAPRSSGVSEEGQ